LYEHVAFGVVASVALREFLDDPDERHRDEGQVREPGCARWQRTIEMFAQPLELGDIDFLDVREVRDATLGVCDSLRADATHAEDSDLLRFGTWLDLCGGLTSWRATGAGPHLEHGVEILSLNSTVAARAFDRSQIDACFACAPP